jgi:Copper transport outer membrane protein, MctB
MSLGAVFLALGIGVLLGVALGENGVVSGASKDLEKSLRGDLNDVRSRNRDLHREIATRADYENQTYQPLVRDLLPGWRVGIVAMGDLPGGYSSDVTAAIEPAGATLDSVSVINAPLQFVEGGDLVDRLRHDLFSSSRGEYRGLDAIVYVRQRDGLQGDDKAAQDRFESGLLAALKNVKVALVGVETTGTDPSQVGYLSGQDVATVDDLDLTAGRTAVVWVLADRASGTYGVKGSADHLLPKAPVQESPRRP